LADYFGGRCNRAMRSLGCAEDDKLASFIGMTV
jgi:hypothetical protein